MTVKPLYVIRADLVLVGVNLLSTDQEIRSFREKVEGDFQQQPGVDINLPLGTSGPSRTLVFPQERITLNSSQARSTARRDYPSIDNLGLELERLSVVVANAIDCTSAESKSRIRSYGYNMLVVFNQTAHPRAIEFVGERLFSSRARQFGSKTQVGGSGVLVFSDGATQWTFRIEPWPTGEPTTNRVSVAVNRHTEVAMGLPPHPNVIQAFMDTWKESLAFMNNLNGLGDPS